MAQNDKFQTFNGYPDILGTRFVDWDEIKGGCGKDIVWTDSVGVCLAVTLYYPLGKVGVLAHIMGSAGSPVKLLPENVIDTLLKELLLDQHPVCFPLLEASLAGEGLLSSHHEKKAPIVRASLMKLGIPIIGEDVCKAPGRFVFLDCATGTVSVYRAGRLTRKDLYFSNLSF